MRAAKFCSSFGQNNYFAKLARGFTLIELMVVIAIVAILAAIAAPSFFSLINSTAQKSTASLLASDLNMARAEAIKRNATVLVCVSNAGATNCSTSSAATWTPGWLVCSQDPAVPNTCAATSAANPNPIVTRPALNTNLTLTKGGTSTSTNPVAFGSNGNAGAATLTLHGTWTGAVDKIVTIANTGNIK